MLRAATRLARRVGALRLREQALGERGPPRQGPLQALDLEQVDADAVHSAQATRRANSGYSTVTVLARLRGWSTFSPRLRAIR